MIDKGFNAFFPVDGPRLKRGGARLVIYVRMIGDMFYLV
jgi:hypothetical protein